MCPVGNATDGINNFTHLEGATSVAIFTIDVRTFAIVASPGDDGVQIMDVSDPSSPVPAGSATDGVGGFTMLKRAQSVATFTIDDSTFAIVGSGADNGIQLMNVSDPYSPVALGTAQDDVGNFSTLAGASGVATFKISAKTYAIVASFYEDGVQLVDVSDPSMPVALGAAIADGPGGFNTLNRATDAAIFIIGDSTFAIVTSPGDNGVQIIEVSDPQNPVAVGFAVDGQNGFDMLGRASGVATFTIGTLTYAIVASVAADGVQIIDVTDPSRPVAVSSATDGEHGFTKLAGARGVSIVVLGPVTYAVVTGSFDNGVQLIDVSDPFKPVAVGSATHGEGGYDPLSGASGVATFGIDGTMYVIVASRDDSGVMLIHVVGGEGKGSTKFGTPSGPTQDEFDDLKDGQNELKDKVEILKEQLAAILAALNGPSRFTPLPKPLANPNDRAMLQL